MKLPKFLSSDKLFTLLQTRWAEILDPIISLPMLQQNTLTSVELVSGSNSINHLLGRKLQGWIITRQNAAASIYDEQDTNDMPNLTLVLFTDADVTVDIVVF